MTRDEFKACLAVLGYSQRQFGEMSGVGKWTSRNWARGNCAVPPEIERWLRAAVDWRNKNPIPQPPEKEPF